MLKSDNFNYLLDTRLRKVYFKTLQEEPTKLPLLYNTSPSSLAIEYDYEVGDISSVPEFTGKLVYQDIHGQYRTEYEHTEFATGIQIERRLLDDDQYSTINKAPTLLAVGMRRKRETDGAYVFNEAFTSGITYGDSQPLCSNSHPHLVSGSAGPTTWDNKGTDAITPAVVSATRISMMKFTSSSNQIVHIDPNVILCPIDLGDTVREVIKSTKKPDTANNNINVNEDRFQIIEWRYLTDTNDWYMLDSRLMKAYLNWFNRIGVEFNKDMDTDTYISKWSTYMRYSNGPSGFRFVYGHEVS